MSVETLSLQAGLTSMDKDTGIPSATPLGDSVASKALKSNKTAPLAARRPTTRSQTGTIGKRPARDDDPIPETKKPTPPARKRHKTVSTPSSSVALDSSSSHTHDSTSPNLPPTRETSLCSTSSTPLLPSDQKAQLTFYHSSMSETDQPLTRLPRSRSSLPVPIPNLTKKSRGRRVPTKVSADVDPNQKDNRLYVCSVEGCGKCFHRGEHLKRHIRSIHTHEKPFRCTFPMCEKYFNRHDNLLQHLKVHRQANSRPDQLPPVPKRPLQEESLTLSAPGTRRQSRHPYSQTEEEEDDEPTSPPSPPVRPRTIYDAYPRYGSYPASPSSSSIPQMVYSHFNQNNMNSEKLGNTTEVVSAHGDMASNEAMSILTNVAVASLRMEVSSLRTELPRSPVDMSTVGVMQMNPC